MSERFPGEDPRWVKEFLEFEKKFWEEVKRVNDGAMAWYEQKSKIPFHDPELDVVFENVKKLLGDSYGKDFGNDKWMIETRAKELKESLKTDKSPKSVPKTATKPEKKTKK